MSDDTEFEELLRRLRLLDAGAEIIADTAAGKHDPPDAKYIGKTGKPLLAAKDLRLARIGETLKATHAENLAPDVAQVVRLRAHESELRGMAWGMLELIKSLNSHEEIEQMFRPRFLSLPGPSAGNRPPPAKTRGRQSQSVLPEVIYLPPPATLGTALVDLQPELVPKPLPFAIVQAEMVAAQHRRAYLQELEALSSVGLWEVQYPSYVEDSVEYSKWADGLEEAILAATIQPPEAPEEPVLELNKQGYTFRVPPGFYSYWDAERVHAWFCPATPPRQVKELRPKPYPVERPPLVLTLARASMLPQGGIEGVIYAPLTALPLHLQLLIAPQHTS